MADRSASNDGGQASASQSAERPAVPQIAGLSLGEPASPAVTRFPQYPSARDDLLTPPMRIRRLPSSPNVNATSSDRPSTAASVSPRPGSPEREGRRRSFSDPNRSLQIPGQAGGRPELRQQGSTQSVLPTVQEERNSFQVAPFERPRVEQPSPAGARGRLRSMSSAARNFISRDRGNSTVSRASATHSDNARSEDYENDIVDYLDVIDPEVSTLTTLNNVQNSLFVPYLGSLYNRQPTYDLSRPTTRDAQLSDLTERKTNQPAAIEEEKPGEGSESAIDDETIAGDEDQGPVPGNLARMNTIKSTLSGMSDGHNYAVLPHGVRLDGWTAAEKAELNDHVRHLLHSRRAGFTRSMRAFGKYVRKPMGFLVTLYAVIITFWGAAWVIFLIGWIHVGDRKNYFVNVCDEILTALLVVIGIGLFPWRIVDTYHMIYIAHYQYKIWELRRERGLPALEDYNDLPETDPRNKPSTIDKDEEAGVGDVDDEAQRHDSVVLTPSQIKLLTHHQRAFNKAHTFYKPHATPTHRAFPIKLLITIVVLLDFHSIFQIALASTTWAIRYEHRARAITAVILACSLTCNILGGILISVGDKRTRRKEVFEQMFRQARTEEAMKDIEKRAGRPRLAVRPSVVDLEQAQQAEQAQRLREEVDAAHVDAAARVSKHGTF